jgi:Ca-activated chloride channel homolog
VSASALAAQQPPPAPHLPPTFRSGVALRVVLVNVADPATPPTRRLSRSDFVVLEDGAPQPLSHFLSAEESVDIALLVDVSSSSVPVLGDVRRTAREFLGALRPGDRVMVIEFDRRIRPVGEFTENPQELARVLGRLRRAGSTSLYDSLYITVKTLASRSRDLARRMAVVVLTDGHDTSSLLPPRHVQEQSTRYGIPIYTILVDELAPPLERSEYRSSSDLFAVRALARSTGGRSFAPTHDRDLARIYQSIAQDLSNQYLLGYMTDSPNAAPRISVRVPSRPSVRVKAYVGRSARISAGG